MGDEGVYLVVKWL